MTKKYHFISGLPRSGSTLLAAILRQNPRFHASMTSGLGALVNGTMQMMSPGSEVSLTLEDGQREGVLRGLFDSFYQGVDKEVIFDTNRGWTSKMPLLAAIHPEAKVIACVRELPWVVDSLERKSRENPYHFTRLFGQSAGSVYSRAETMMQHEGIIGRAYTGLKEAFYGEQAKNLLVVEYELLAKAPEKILPLIYEFLDEPYFEHDFNNVEFDAPEFDEALGVSGLHKVRPQVALQSRRTLLPPDLFKRFQGMDFWRDLEASQANVIATKKNPEGSAVE